jgi:hypothetical protein
MSELREVRFKTTSVWADQSMLDIQLNSGLHDDWRIVTVVFQPDFKDALGNNHRASYGSAKLPRAAPTGGSRQQASAAIRRATAAQSTGSNLARAQPYSRSKRQHMKLALQLSFMKISESMGNHDLEIVDASSVDRGDACVVGRVASGG